VVYTLLAFPLVAIGADMMTPEPVEVIHEPVVEEQVEEPREVLIRVEYTTEGIKRLIRETFPEDAETALKIAACESGYNPEAYNPTNNSHDRGIFQISDKYHKKTWTEMGYTDMHDVKQNIEYARVLYEESGWNHWVCYTRKMI